MQERHRTLREKEGDNRTPVYRRCLPKPVLANATGDGKRDIACPATQRAARGVLEGRYRVLRENIRDHVTGQRRPMLRYFGAGCVGGWVSRRAD
jgi:hypothetical protein